MNMKRMLLASLGGAALLTLAHGPAFAGKDDDTVVWATGSEVDTADLYYQNLREVVIMAHQVCDTLMHRDPYSGEYKPLLAKSYEWVDDKTLDFTLRTGIKFHDGSDFDAEDVAYTLNHASKKENGAVTQLVVDWIDHVEVLAPDKVRIHTKAPTPAALAYLSGVTPIYPKGHYDKAPEVAGANGKKRRDWGAVVPVCTGPYKITKFVPGSSVTMVKNDHYFADSPKGKPSIGKLVYRTIPDTETQLAELMTGGIDWVWGVPSENAAQLKSVPNVTVKAAPTTRMSFLSLDAAGRSGETPLKDVRVRRAIYHAIDRNALTHQLVGDGAEVLKSMCAPTQFGCATDVQVFDYDPAKAKKLLAEAGYPDGFSIPL